MYAFYVVSKQKTLRHSYLKIKKLSNINRCTYSSCCLYFFQIHRNFFSRTTRDSKYYIKHCACTRRYELFCSYIRCLCTYTSLRELLLQILFFQLKCICFCIFVYNNFILYYNQPNKTKYN